MGTEVSVTIQITSFLTSGRFGMGASQDQLLAGFTEPLVFIFRKVSMSIAAFLTHSVRSRVDVLTSKEFTTVARSLHRTNGWSCEYSTEHCTRLLSM